MRTAIIAALRRASNPTMYSITKISLMAHVSEVQVKQAIARLNLKDRTRFTGSEAADIIKELDE